ncbi:hypothetical protein CTheo_9105 [Ceratobasidium theobromae]|uniref:Uncharacterized protein n=1 Tax=Ceratobasidium theobromae TaxID=1582974 RepID=A0A5N5Q7T7_9AGAM|nr:hypothetical protein CTheo_9105 [Ceratobasidium theobromae]
MLSSKEFDPSYVEHVVRVFTNIIHVRFGERHGNRVVSGVQLVPRGCLALGTIIAMHPTFDFDLIIPGDYVLRRWNCTPNEHDDGLLPSTISKVLDLNPGSILRGEIKVDKLHSVFEAIWRQLNGSADHLIFPGGQREVVKYLPSNWCSLREVDDPEPDRIQLVTAGKSPVYINLFVKVGLRQYGQDLVVGVDPSSAWSDGEFQMVKAARAPGVSLSEAPLPPVDRSAILSLMWWENSLPKGDREIARQQIPASHFILALSALRQADPVGAIREPFSLLAMFTRMLDILRYLQRAYTYPLVPGRAPASGLMLPFPLVVVLYHDGGVVYPSSRES